MFSQHSSLPRICQHSKIWKKKKASSLFSLQHTHLGVHHVLLPSGGSHSSRRDRSHTNAEKQQHHICGEEQAETMRAEVPGQRGPGPCSVKRQLLPWEADRGLELKASFSVVSSAAWATGRSSPLKCAFRSTHRAIHQRRGAVPLHITKADASRQACYVHVCVLELVVGVALTL